MSAEGWSGFRAAVYADPALQARLLAAPDRRAFVDLVVTLAAARHLEVSAREVGEVISESRRAWYARWI